jgi:hypothetical protein
MEEMRKQMKRLMKAVEPEAHTSLDCEMSTFSRAAGISVVEEYIAYIGPNYNHKRPGIIRHSESPSWAVDAVVDEYNAFEKFRKENA